MRLACKSLLITVVCSALVAVVACVSAPRVIPVKTDHVAAMHAVHSEHVTSLMMSISRSHSRVRSYRGPLALDRDRDYEAITGHASEVAGYAKELRGLANRGSFLGENRNLFLTYVDRLRKRAGELEAAAETRNGVKVKRAFAQLTATCNSCHFAFRDQIQMHQLTGYRPNDGTTN